jgi:hypothetical protein
MVNTGANGLTIRRPGTYTVAGRVGMLGAPANAARCLIQILKTGAVVIVQNELSALSGTNLVFPATDDVTLASGDALTMVLYQNSGSSWSANVGAVPYSSGLLAREVISW